MKTLAEAAYLRDHVIAQLDLADASHGRGRTGLPAPVRGGRRRLRRHRDRGLPAAPHHRRRQALPPRLDPRLIKWHLVDLAPKLHAGARRQARRQRAADPRASAASTSRSAPASPAVTEDEVTLTDGRVLPSPHPDLDGRRRREPAGRTRSAPRPCAAGSSSTPDLTVPGLDGVFALGDAAAVPDLAKGGRVARARPPRSTRCGRAGTRRQRLAARCAAGPRCRTAQGPRPGRRPRRHATPSPSRSAST